MSYVISGLGAAIIEYEMDFSKEAKKNNLRNPFKVQQEIFSKRCYDGIDKKTGLKYMGVRDATPEEKALEPSKEEVNNYIKTRDFYIARRVYEDRGYDDFWSYINLSKSDFEKGKWDELIDKFIPCESGTGQCRIECKFYKKGCSK